MQRRDCSLNTFSEVDFVNGGHCVGTLLMVDTLCVDFVNGHSVDTLDVVPRSSELIVPSSIECSGGGPQ